MWRAIAKASKKSGSLVSYNWEVISRLEKIPIMPLASNPPVRETHRK